MPRLKLHGFNNLTKSLSFCIYDICYAETVAERDGYIAYIDEQYNASRLTEILVETCSLIGANVLSVARQDYEPQGASVTILASEEPVKPNGVKPPQPESVVAHLDKSHICVHTYPESHPGCGVYRVRGFTRDVYGVKHYIDHEINSIQNFISPEIKSLYQMVDVNVYQENIFHTKMLLKAFDLHDYLFSTRLHTLSEARQLEISKLLCKEMQEIYSGRNMP